MNKNTYGVMIGLALGILGGIFFPEVMNAISFLGTIYLNLLKFMIVPIILTSIIVTMYESKKLNRKILVKTVLLFITMFLLTFLLTSGIVSVLEPGKGFEVEKITWDGEVTNIHYSDVLIHLFPSNMIDMFQSNSIFAIILFAILFGIAATKTPNGEKVISIIESVKEVFFKMLEYLMYIAPIGTFSLIGGTVANYGKLLFGVGIRYIGMAYLCSIIALFVIMILPVWLIAKISPWQYVKKVSKVWSMTITTCSSAATLPTTMKTCHEDFKIPNSITNIVVPLGCTIHMCGGAVSFALLGIFCLQLFQIPLTFMLFIEMIVSATIINMAAPGIPNGGIVIGATFLALLGIPLELVGLYGGIYKLLDMAYTTLNVTGDITANILLAKFDYQT